MMEVRKCRKSFPYFCGTYCRILADDGAGGAWVPFTLWPEQQRVARLLQEHRLVVALKARQLGLTWLVLAFALWLMLFSPIATVLLFSRRDDEAVDLLAVRLRGMYNHLPAFLKASSIRADNDHEWVLSNGSRALAFPNGGRQLHGDAGGRGRGRPVPGPRQVDARRQADDRRGRADGASQQGEQVETAEPVQEDLQGGPPGSHALGAGVPALARPAGS